MKWWHYPLIGLVLVGFIALYHFGMFNLVMPGQKTVSRKTAKRFARYVADCANTGIQNLGASNPPSFTSPAPLPLFDTWGNEDGEKKAA